MMSDRGRVDQAGAGTRAHRSPGSEVAPPGEVKLSPGGAAELINLSETGALVETLSRFAVGAAVSLCIGGPRPQRLPGRVVRCQVCGIHRNNSMSYQLALAFDDSTRADVPEKTVDVASGSAPGNSDDSVGPSAADVTAGCPETEELVNEW